MSEYVSRILDTSISGLHAQQAKIAVTSNNISNVNTEGYVRRDVNLTAKEASFVNGLNVGAGVDVSGLIRQTNDYLEKMLREATADSASADIQDSYLSRIQSIFSLTDTDITTIGSALTDFFAAAGDLAVNPSNTELRANFIAKTESLCSMLAAGYTTMSSLQTEIDERIVTEVSTVNSIISEIASLNQSISDVEVLGNVAADSRDARANLINKLSEKISFDVIEQPNGAINITLSNGFALVANNKAYELSTSTDVGDGTEPRALDGGSLNYIVYDYSDGTKNSVLNLTDLFADGEGSIGGLLKVRGVYSTNDPSVNSAFNGDGYLVEYAARIEAISRSLLTEINTTYQALNAAGVSTAGDLDGNPPGVFGLFTFANAIDSDGDGVATTADIEDALAKNNYTNISSRLEIAISDPADVAAAIADDPTAGTLTFSSGNGKNMEALVNEQLKVRNFQLGTFTTSVATYGAEYDELVSKVGNAKNISLISASVAQANLSTAQSQRDEQSAVSLDEEFVHLIEYQRAYQASARLINIADQLLQEVLNTL